MSKKIFTAALFATMAIGANAQAPVLNKVKTIIDPVISGVRPLAGEVISGVSVVGNTLFYCGYETGAGQGTKATLVRVVNWGTSSAAFTQLFRDETPTRGRPSKVAATSSLVFFGTSVGEGSNLLANNFQTEVYRLLYDGSNPVSGISNFADGKLTSTEIGYNAGFGMQDLKIDPGFGATPSSILTTVQFGSRTIRGFDYTSGSQTRAIGSPTPYGAIRGYNFDAAGNVYFKHVLPSAASIVKFARNAENSSGIAGLDSGTIINSNVYHGETQGQNILWIPATASSAAFVMHNDMSLNGTLTTNGALLQTYNESGNGSGYPFLGGNSTTSTFGSVTATVPFAFQSREVGMTTANINGTQYIFLANFTGGANVVEVIQVGDAGQISGNIVFSDLVTTAPTARQATIILKDPTTGNVLDARVVTTDSSGNYSFITTLRGNVNVFIDANHYLVKASSANISLTGATANVNATLINGDIDNDNFVGLDDFNLLSNSFNLALGDTGFVANADLDEDEFVGLDDFNILSNNFNIAGDE